MNVLVVPLAPLWSPHFEADMELIRRHQAFGDEVAVISCHAELASCVANPGHSRIDCWACMSKSDRALDSLDRSVRVLRIPRQRFMREAERLLDPLPQALSELRDVADGGLQLGPGIASSLVSVLREANPSIEDHRHLVVALTASALQMAAAVREAVHQFAPDVVYAFNGRFATAVPIAEVCRELGITFRSHDSSHRRDRYRVVEDAPVHSLVAAADEIESVWVKGESDPDRTIKASAFYEDRRFGGQHSPEVRHQFTRSQVPGSVPSWLSDEHVVFFNSSEDEFTALDEYTNPVYADQIEGLDMLATDPRLRDVPLALRVHPNLAGLNNQQIQHLSSLESLKNFKLIPATSKFDTYAVLERARVVVTFGSTIGIEAVYWRRPSVLIGRAFYERLGPTRPTSHDEVVRELLGEPPVAPIEGALKYGYFNVEGGVRFQDGYAPTDPQSPFPVHLRPHPVFQLLRRGRNLYRMSISATATTQKRSFRSRGAK